MANTIVSQAFCCASCGGDVILDLSYGGELYYECQNPKCRRAVSVDCPEALALKNSEVLVGSLDGEPVTADIWSRADHEDPNRGYEIVVLNVTWMGREVSVDTEIVNIPSKGHLHGDINLADYAWLKEAMSANVIDRLLAMARILCDKPLPNYKPRTPQPTPPAIAPITVMYDNAEPTPAPRYPEQPLAGVVVNECIEALTINRVLGLSDRQQIAVSTTIDRVVSSYIPDQYRYDTLLHEPFVVGNAEYKRGYREALAHVVAVASRALTADEVKNGKAA